MKFDALSATLHTTDPMHRLVVTLFTAILALPEVSAQSRKLAFRTLCMGYVGEIKKVYLAGDGTEVPLYTDISPVVEGTFQAGAASFLIEPPAPDDKEAEKPIATGRLASSNRQLFVFVPVKEPKEGEAAYTVKCYDDDTSTFAMGNIRAINLAPVPVRFQLAGQTTPQIPSGKYALFPHSKINNDYNMYPVVVEFLSANGEWVKGQSVSWKATDRRREVVITLVDLKFKQPVVRIYSDFPSWVAPKE